MNSQYFSFFFLFLLAFVKTFTLAFLFNVKFLFHSTFFNSCQTEKIPLFLISPFPISTDFRSGFLWKRQRCDNGSDWKSKIFYFFFFILFFSSLFQNVAQLIATIIWMLNLNSYFSNISTEFNQLLHFLKQKKNF